MIGIMKWFKRKNIKSIDDFDIEDYKILMIIIGNLLCVNKNVITIMKEIEYLNSKYYYLDGFGIKRDMLNYIMIMDLSYKSEYMKSIKSYIREQKINQIIND